MQILNIPIHLEINILPFLPDRMLVNKVDKLICSEYDKTKYSVHILALQQALKHGLILKKCIR